MPPLILREIAMINQHDAVGDERVAQVVAKGAPCNGQVSANPDRITASIDCHLIEFYIGM